MSNPPATDAPAKSADPEATPVPSAPAVPEQQHAGVISPPQPPLAQPPPPPQPPPPAPAQASAEQPDFPMPTREQFIAEGFDPKDYESFIGALSRNKRTKEIARSAGGIVTAPIGGAPAGDPGKARDASRMELGDHPTPEHAAHAVLAERHAVAKALVAELEGPYLRAVQVAERLAAEVRRSEGFLPTLRPAFVEVFDPHTGRMSAKVNTEK
jgi:hypothetical protein